MNIPRRGIKGFSSFKNSLIILISHKSTNFHKQQNRKRKMFLCLQNYDYDFLQSKLWNSKTGKYVYSNKRYTVGKLVKEVDKEVNWSNISACQKLSEQFIEKYQDKVDWDNISKYQKLSEQFIEKHQNKIKQQVIKTKNQ
jgi:hypothetical protein